MSIQITNRKSIIKKYNSSAAVYDSLYRKEQILKRQKIVESGLKLGYKLLDIGCGTGVSMIDEKPIDYSVGLDISIEMLRLARKKRKEVILGDMTSIPFRDNSFDSLTFVTSFHHAPKKRRVINDILRIVKPGGYVCSSLLKKAKVRKQIEALTRKELKLVYLEDANTDLILILKKTNYNSF
ncbi:MAG: methyltransferase domain-containing protein [Conexivisphaerales archaeon]